MAAFINLMSRLLLYMSASNLNLLTSAVSMGDSQKVVSAYAYTTFWLSPIDVLIDGSQHFREPENTFTPYMFFPNDREDTKVAFLILSLLLVGKTVDIFTKNRTVFRQVVAK